jgi:hypothetical protein
MAAWLPLTLTRRTDAVPHRHSRRGPFALRPLPDGLLVGLRHDALAEDATLALVGQALAYHGSRYLLPALNQRLEPGTPAAPRSALWLPPWRPGVLGCAASAALP